jgi:hypothetical protein
LLYGVEDLIFYFSTHLGGIRRLLKSTGAILYGAEQARIAEGDRRVIGQGIQQVLFAQPKGIGLFAQHNQQAGDFLLDLQRDDQRGQAKAGNLKPLQRLAVDGQRLT